MANASRTTPHATLSSYLPTLVLVLGLLSHSAAAMEIEADALPIVPPLRTHGDFSTSARDHLASAFQVAMERLRSHDACRALFTNLGADGGALLARSRYVRTSQREEMQFCGRSIAAFTGVGSPVTRLCRRFRRLQDEQGALILLHEALHFAGQTEAPHEPGAPTSQEINERVAKSCGL